ncbi:hypothetical protein, partial [Burkholderia pseudomultivorans]|uniref:hypothetical protein n=1 Tax=Burkholderia pseudomultivorans TaxID=1207504 RepID=UPI001E3CB159
MADEVRGSGRPTGGPVHCRHMHDACPELTNGLREHNKKRRQGRRQIADEPHVFGSVGFCLSGIRIASSP